MNADACAGGAPSAEERGRKRAQADQAMSHGPCRGAKPGPGLRGFREAGDRDAGAEADELTVSGGAAACQLSGGSRGGPPCQGLPWTVSLGRKIAQHLAQDGASCPHPTSPRPGGRLSSSTVQGWAVSPTLAVTSCLCWQVGGGPAPLQVGLAWLRFWGDLKVPLQSQAMTSCLSTLRFVPGTQSPSPSEARGAPGLSSLWN